MNHDGQSVMGGRARPFSLGGHKPKNPADSLEEDLDAFLDEYEKTQCEKSPPDELLEDIP
jgi:hypothetical protein